MSSGGVYSQSNRKHSVLVVDDKTELNPSTAYGEGGTGEIHKKEQKQ